MTATKRSLDETQPALLRGSVGALVAAVLALAVSLGAPISDETQAALLAVLAAATPIVTAWWIRRKVWSPASHERAVAEAARRRRP